MFGSIWKSAISLSQNLTFVPSLKFPLPVLNLFQTRSCYNLCTTSGCFTFNMIYLECQRSFNQNLLPRKRTTYRPGKQTSDLPLTTEMKMLKVLSLETTYGVLPWRSIIATINMLTSVIIKINIYFQWKQLTTLLIKMKNKITLLQQILRPSPSNHSFKISRDQHYQFILFDIGEH